MASLKGFVLKPCRSRLCINMAIRTLTSNSSSPSSPNQRHQFHHSEDLGNRIYTGMNKSSSSKLTSGFPGIFSLVPAALAGFFGAGMLSYTDANEVDSQTPPLSESLSSLPESPLVLPKSSEPLAETPPVAPPSAYEDLEKIVKQERERLEELLKSRGMRYGSYPRYTVAMKGQKVSVKFQIPSTCEISHMIVDLASNLGLKLEQPGGGSEMILRVWNSPVAWQLTLNHPEVKKGDLGDTVTSESKKGHQGSLCVLIYQSLISLDNAEIEFIKQGSFSTKELDAFVSALKLAALQMGLKRSMTRRPGEYLDRQDNDTQKSVAALESMGVRIFGLNATHENSSVGKVSWDNIAGYHEQKREVEDTVLLSLHSPKVFDDIARGTRRIFESNRPRAVLFEGPPGTGKTSCARVIANQASLDYQDFLLHSLHRLFHHQTSSCTEFTGVPLLYVPLEAVMSKYYGESERLFGKVFSLANELPGGAIIFLDEIDSFAATRDDGMHEATRRILSVLLRQIDGFEQEKKVVVIAATNRKEDLDPALISRFDSIITFGLPDQQTRQEIAAQYAKHLNSSELVQFAAITEEMSGRDIRDVCQQAERHWASKIIRGQASNEGEQCCLPPLQEYIDSAIYRKNALLSLRDKQNQVPRKKRRPMEFL